MAIHEGDAGFIQKQYRQLGSPYKYLGSPGSQIGSTLDISKDAAEGLLAIADFVPGQNTKNRQYAEAYRKEYGEDFVSTAMWAYDAMNILAEAIKVGGEDRQKIRQAILALSHYEGALGTFSFTPNGDGLHEVSVVQIEGGRPKVLKSLRVDTQ